MNPILRTIEVIDSTATGEQARAEREAAGLSLREMARRMGVSAPYVCDLELGRRAWSMDRVRRWNEALGGGDAR